MKKLIQGNCLSAAKALGQFDMVFADPPDNLGLNYDHYQDKLPPEEYVDFLWQGVNESVQHAPIVWWSFYYRWTASFGAIVDQFLKEHDDWTYHPCVQVFTFGQHNHHWLGNNHRPLWCLYRKDAPFFPDAIRVESWRQKNGDKRADPRGRVPGDVLDFQYPFPFDDELIRKNAKQLSEVFGPLCGTGYIQAFKQMYDAGIKCGDVFDFPRVTGNSKQRCDWHPTQLHEELIERIVKFSTPEGGRVLDLFAGTGTTFRTCGRIGRNVTAIEVSRDYCERIAADNSLISTGQGIWSDENRPHLTTLG